MMKETCARLYLLISMMSSAFCVAALLSPSPAYAYIGPGLSVGAAVVVFIVLFSIILAIYALVWYPLKRRIVSKREKNRGSLDQ